jgi:hypothetical protein
LEVLLHQVPVTCCVGTPEKTSVKSRDEEKYPEGQWTDDWPTVPLTVPDRTGPLLIVSLAVPSYWKVPPLPPVTHPSRWNDPTEPPPTFASKV